jgi:hypothetical protein
MMQCRAVATTGIAGSATISSICLADFASCSFIGRDADQPGADRRPGEVGQPWDASANRTWDVARRVAGWGGEDSNLRMGNQDPPNFPFSSMSVLKNRSRFAPLPTNELAFFPNEQLVTLCSFKMTCLTSLMRSRRRGHAGRSAQREPENARAASKAALSPGAGRPTPGGYLFERGIAARAMSRHSLAVNARTARYQITLAATPQLPPPQTTRPDALTAARRS